MKGIWRWSGTTGNKGGERNGMTKKR